MNKSMGIKVIFTLEKKKRQNKGNKNVQFREIGKTFDGKKLNIFFLTKENDGKLETDRGKRKKAQKKIGIKALHKERKY